MSKYSSKEPKLIDDDIAENITNNKSQNYTEGTNMLVDFFANSEKLVDTDKRVAYGDEGYNDNNDDRENNDNLDDDVNKYRKQSYPAVTQNIFENKQNHHESDHNKSEHYSDKKNNDSYTESASGGGSKEYDPEDESTWTKEELLLRKLDMLRKLGELVQHGGVKKLSQNYSLNSDYKTMKFEYDLHSGIRSKKNAVEWMSGMMIGIVKGMELLNDNLNPFDIKFENTWSNKVTADISDYYDVLGEIYEKYTTPGKKMAPELKLFLMLTGSAVSIQMHKGINSLTNASGELDKDPVLIRQLREKAEQEQATEKNRLKIQEQLEKQHQMATERANDLNMINNARNEYAELQKMANMKNIEGFNNTLILSESAKSAKSGNAHMSDSSHKTNGSKINESFVARQAEQNKQREILLQNQRLMEMQKMLRDMNNEEKITESVSKQKRSKKPMQLKGTDSNKKSTPKSTPKSPKSQKQVDNDTDSNISTASSKSVMLVNPNLENILGNKKQPTLPPKQNNKPIDPPQLKRLVEKSSNSSDESESSISTQSSKSSKKQIVLNLDDKLKQLKQSNNVTPLKMMNRNEVDKDIAFESISFGKRSDGSGSSRTGKRGRPKKSMKVSLGD